MWWDGLQQIGRFDDCLLLDYPRSGAEASTFGPDRKSVSLLTDAASFPAKLMQWLPNDSRRVSIAPVVRLREIAAA